jgi:hypothetical protein
MQSRDKALIGLLTLLIFLVSSVLYFFVTNYKVFGTEESLAYIHLNDLPEVESANIEIQKELKQTYPIIEICYQENCKEISSDIVESFYQNNEIEEIKVYTYILDKILPYFEKISGGKVLFKNSNGSFYAWREDKVIDLGNIYEDILDLLKNRDPKQFVLKYNLVKKDLPGTDGKYADRYIEVDNSKQKLYAWMDGKVIKEIYLSAAKSGYEVYGVFPIVDKGIQPIAPGGKYMPYWMAFYYSPKQSSWYGLHGLIWWYDEDGNKIYESENNIGLRKSAGCIRMLKDDAKFLYDRYEIEDPVLIHK